MRFLNGLTPLLPPLLLQTANAIDTPLNYYAYCIRYYGSVSSSIELPLTLPEYNYNQTIRCPTSMLFPTRSGATLTICPPTSSLNDDDPVAMSAELRLSAVSGVLTDPIDNLHLSPRLITNGSTGSTTFTNAGVPALIAHDPAHELSPFLPTWTINGTQSSLTDSPDLNDRTNTAFFGCDYPSSPYYCGGFEDRHAPDGGCWRGQNFLFNMRNALNFTYRFSNSEASVEIWARSPLAQGEDTGTTKNVSEAYISFGGNRRLPSVVDYDFWENAEADYEVETAFVAERAGMRFEMGADGLPVFVNGTEGGGEAFAVGNGTVIGEGGAAGVAALWDGGGVLVGAGVVGLLLV